MGAVEKLEPQGKEIPASVKHTASVRFWTLYEALPKPVRTVADKNFQLLKSDPKHPSLHFKRI